MYIHNLNFEFYFRQECLANFTKHKIFETLNKTRSIDNSSDMYTTGIGAGVGILVLLLFGVLVWKCCKHRRGLSRPIRRRTQAKRDRPMFPGDGQPLGRARCNFNLLSEGEEPTMVLSVPDDHPEWRNGGRPRLDTYRKILEGGEDIVSSNLMNRTYSTQRLTSDTIYWSDDDIVSSTQYHTCSSGGRSGE